MEGAGALLCSPVVLLNGVSLPLCTRMLSQNQALPVLLSQRWAVALASPSRHFSAPVLAVWSRGKPNLMPFIWVCLGSNNEVKFDS